MRPTQPSVVTRSPRFTHDRNGLPPRSCRSRAFPEEAAEDEADVGRAFAETAHEVGKPFAPEWNVDADPVALRRELRLQVTPDAVEHLELVPVFGYAAFAREAPGGVNHGRVVRRDCRVNPVREQHAHDLDE